jgi:hypothetical protein
MLRRSDWTAVKIVSSLRCRFDNPRTAVQENGTYGGQGKAAGGITSSPGGFAVSGAQRK